MDRWWYPICGYNQGWCLSEDGCKPVEGGGDPLLDHLNCSLCIRRRPKNGREPSTRRSGKR